MKVVWTEQAAQRLLQIKEFIARDSMDKAAQFVERLIKRGENLASFPNSGRKVPELGLASIREVIEGNYRLVYRATPNQIEILTVFEGHREFPHEDLQGPH